MDTKEVIKKLAVKAYDAYSAAVGGVNFKGEPLPTGEEFMNDPDKAKQAAGWLAVAETSRKEIYDLADTLDKEAHAKLIAALVSSHLAKYGESYLGEKARTWLQNHEWVRTVLLLLLAFATAWGIFGCTSAVQQTQTAADGTENTTIRVFSLSATEARDLIKLYGAPQIPSVNVTK